MQICFIYCIVLKETNDIFEPRVRETLFIPINVIVKAFKFSKMTSSIK